MLEINICFDILKLDSVFMTEFNVAKNNLWNDDSV